MNRDDAELPALPGIPEARFACNGFGAGVVGLARELRLCPMLDHSEHPERTCPITRNGIGAGRPDKRRY